LTVIVRDSGLIPRNKKTVQLKKPHLADISHYLIMQ
jgi:hypothetical protein